MSYKSIIQNSIFWLLPFFLICVGTASGQTRTTARDTVFVYETVMVYDTLVIYDTIRIKKTPALPVLEQNDSVTSFFEQQTATFSENGIILHENKNRKRTKDMKFNLKPDYLSAFFLTIQSLVNLSAQEPGETSDLKRLPVQMSVVYPMTTQGQHTVDYNYTFSFNLLTGRVGAVTGVEFGTILNQVERDVKGIQFSGLVNMTRNVTGIQFGGLGNITKNVKGIQFSGLGNIAGNVTGIQYGDFINITESSKGVQFSGLININKYVSGIQFGGIANLTERNQGVQISGIANVTCESKGFQFAGITNVSNEVSGVSIGGIFNHTKTLRGLQFGIVNVVDTIEKGASIALINIVKKGFYDEWSLAFSDYINVGLSYKMGTKKFYTIYTIGANFIEDKLWVIGIGFGNRTPLGKRFDFQPEFVSYNYYLKDFSNASSTWTTHMKLGFIYNLNEKLGIVLAPSLYHLNEDMSMEHYEISPRSPFFIHEYDNIKSSFGFGLSLGLILR